MDKIIAFDLFEPACDNCLTLTFFVCLFRFVFLTSFFTREKSTLHSCSLSTCFLSCVRPLKLFQRKISDLENLVKTLETNLSEKEAAIRILKSNKTMSSGNFEDFFAAVHAANAAPSSQSQTSINISDQSNILSIPIQQQQHQQHLQQQQQQLQQQQLQQHLQQQQQQHLQQQHNHRIIHNKSLSHLMTPSSMMPSLPTVVTPSTYGFSPPSYGIASSSSPYAIPASFGVSPSSYVVTPSSYVVTPSSYGGFHHVKQLSTPNVSAFQTSSSGSRLAPNFLAGKGRSITPSADMLMLRYRHH